MALETLYEKYQERDDVFEIEPELSFDKWTNQEKMVSLDRVIETIWSHYKNKGGYTNTGAEIISKITGEKWEVDDGKGSKIRRSESCKRLISLDELTEIIVNSSMTYSFKDRIHEDEIGIEDLAQKILDKIKENS